MGNRFSESTAKPFVYILKFIFTPICEMKIVISKFDQSFLMAWKCFKSLSALMPKLTPLERKVRIQANQSKPQPDLVLSGELTPRSINQFVNLFSGNFDEGQRMRILNLFFWNMSSNYFSFNCLAQFWLICYIVLGRIICVNQYISILKHSFIHIISYQKSWLILLIYIFHFRAIKRTDTS